MIGISSPFAERGLLYEKFRDFYGKDDHDTLVHQGLAPATSIRPLTQQKSTRSSRPTPTVPGANGSASSGRTCQHTSIATRLEYCVDRDVHERPF